MTTTSKRLEWWLETPDEFYVYHVHSGFMRVEAEPVLLDGMGEIDAFVVHYPDDGWGNKRGWAVAEGVTGLRLGTDDRTFGETKEHAIQLAMDHILANGLWDRTRFREIATSMINKYGVSPRYRLEELSE